MVQVKYQKEPVDPIPNHPVYKFGSEIVDSCIRTAPSPPPLLHPVAALRALSCMEQPAYLRLAPVPSRHVTIRRFNDPPVPRSALLSPPWP